MGQAFLVPTHGLATHTSCSLVIDFNFVADYFLGLYLLDSNGLICGNPSSVMVPDLSWDISLTSLLRGSSHAYPFAALADKIQQSRRSCVVDFTALLEFFWRDRYTNDLPRAAQVTNQPTYHSYHYD